MALNTVKVLKHIDLTGDVFELIIEKPAGFEFQAGQFITFKVDDKTPPCFRAYSIASAPQKETIDLCIKTVEGGRGSNWLNGLKKGNQVSFIGPNGKFNYQNPDNINKKVLFIATGTGIAPFKSIIDEYINNSEQKAHLIFGVRYEKDIFYKKQFEETHLKNKNFTYDITISRPEESYTGQTGRVTELLKDFDTNNTVVYICGLKDMIDSVLKILQEKGVPKESIHFEKYD